ncbi:MAG: hypothetical protein AXA67_10925 [Methylothermaceae bacteria B42]|nr:MAG: hypothetical protein AXA67_10925 [Methylothermaceae bacteria B42]
MASSIFFYLNFASDSSTEGIKQGFRQGGWPIFAQAWQRYFEHKGLIWQPNAESLAEFRF